jgi:HK97 family phage major capsid protein
MTPTSYRDAVALQSELTTIIAKAATEGRELTDNEKSRVAEIQTKTAEHAAAAVDNSEGRRAFLAGVETERKDALVIKTKDRLADHFKSALPDEFQHLSLGRYVRGVATGNWAGSALELKAAMSSVATAGGFLMPDVLSARVLDLARNRALTLQAGVGTMPMTTHTMYLAKVTEDPTVEWTAENATIDETDLTFTRLQFDANKMAALVRISNELLEDAPNVDQIVETTLGAAMALELDRCILTGDGVAKPKGIFATPGVETLTSIGTPSSYDKWLDAIYAIRGNNYEPSGIFYSPRTAKTLAKLVTGLASDKTKLVAPTDFAALPKYITKQIADNLGVGTNESYSIVGDFSQYLVALRADVRLEISREAGTAFEKDQTLIRVVWRGDGMPVQAKAFAVLSGILA